MLHLAAGREPGPSLVRDVAKDLDVPFPFLAKIMQQLAKQGLVNSQKGRGGGVQLARAAQDITLLEVVEAIDGLELTRRCLLGLPDCSDDDPCQLYGQWGRIRGEIVTMLEDQTLAGLVEEQGEGLHTLD
jgi:Rrf2 family protein